MCGIAGIIGINKNDINPGRLKKMSDIIAHRGPDAEGIWISDHGNVGFAHRRLSIIDLTYHGNQPMQYMSRYTIVFNGEIYNYIELKNTLRGNGYEFRSESDTEVIMALYDNEKDNCLSYLDGMFSFVIYDSYRNEIFGARDRFGEKPFYYSYKKGAYFIFGSEIKCLWEAGIKKEVNLAMLFRYLNYGSLQNLDNPFETFYENCENLPHSHCFTLNVDRCELFVKKYYDIRFNIVDHTISEQKAAETFRELFYKSVSRRLRSDVPVGSSLSGGLDSSLIVCAISDIQKRAAEKLNSFSAVFPGFKKDEKKYIDLVVQKAKAIAHFTTPDGTRMVDEMDKLIWHQEEPFGTASIYAQYCVMRLAKEAGVTVLLDGQGADEYLAGYPIFYHPYFYELKQKYSEKAKAEYREYLSLHHNNPINNLQKKDFKYWARTNIPQLLRAGKNITTRLSHRKENFFAHDFFYENIKQNAIPYKYPKSLNEALYHNLFEGELQELLRFCDRNSMAHSREVRLPFLSHELVDFVFSLPPYFKINHGWSKWILRNSFSHILPSEIAWRIDKIGYEPPHQNWMKEKKMQDKIRESTLLLYNKNIISKKEMERKRDNHSEPKENARAWAACMAASLFVN